MKGQTGQRMKGPAPPAAFVFRPLRIQFFFQLPDIFKLFLARFNFCISEAVLLYEAEALLSELVQGMEL